MWKSRATYPIAFLLGLIAFVVFNSKNQNYFNEHNDHSDPQTKETHQQSRVSKSFHPIHEDRYVKSSKSTSPAESSQTQNGSSEKTPQGLVEQAEEAYKSRALASRDEWDEKKKSYPEIILYLIDRHPKEVAEEVVNAFR